MLLVLYMPSAGSAKGQNMTRLFKIWLAGKKRWRWHEMRLVDRFLAGFSVSPALAAASVFSDAYFADAYFSDVLIYFRATSDWLFCFLFFFVF